MPRLKGKKLEEREQLIEKAMVHYRKSNTASLRISAETFGISWTTLRDRLNGAQSRRNAHQSQQLLNQDEEGCIVSWCQRMDDWGFPVRLSLVKELAAYLVSKRNGPDRKLGQHWLSRFLARHPELSSRFGGRMDRQRAVTSNQQLLKDYFKKLKEIIAKYDILPRDTYNMDEKGFMMGMCAKVKVICRTGRKNPHLTHSGNRTWVTVIETISAAGIVLPPMVINQGTAHYKGWYAEVERQDLATFAYSPKGWTDSKLGVDWLTENFDKYTASVAGDRWRLLILDGHASHVTWEFFDFCINNKIIPFCLPPHSTHLLQPLDVGLFSPLQKHYSNILDEVMEQSGGDTGINKGIFLKYLFEARKRTYTTHNILAAWAKAGIVPFNPRRVLQPIIPPKPLILVSGPTTPKNTRMARSTANQALALIRGGSKSAEKLRTLIRNLDKGLQISLTEKEIGDHIHSQFRKSVAKKARQASTKDRKQLSKARVITSEDVDRLKKARDAADNKKAAQALAREVKKSAVGKGNSKRKTVTISENITVHPIEFTLEVDEVEDSEGWVEIEDIIVAPAKVEISSRRSCRKKTPSRRLQD